MEQEMKQKLLPGVFCVLASEVSAAPGTGISWVQLLSNWFWKPLKKPL